MGFDSIEPYLEYRERGAIILARTSNPGGSDLQFLKVSESGKIFLCISMWPIWSLKNGMFMGSALWLSVPLFLMKSRR